MCKISIFILLAVLPSIFGFDPSQYTNKKQLAEQYTVHWKAVQSTQQIYIALEVSALGWIGFGIGELSSGSMPGADVAIIQKNITTGEYGIQDRYTTAFAEPLMDDCPYSDWILVSAEVNNGKTYVELSRHFIARDNQDRTLVAGDNAIIIAWGDNNAKTLGYHGSNRVATTLCFWGCPIERISPLPNSQTLVALMPNITIPAEETTYMCYSMPFSTPKDTDAHVVQLKFIGDPRSTPFVHHMLLHLCQDYETVDGLRSIPTIYSSPDVCVGRNHPQPLGYPGCTVLYTWARGGRPMNLPHEAGFRIKSTNKSSYYFVLDMHYNNPKKVSGVSDASGIELLITTDLRKHDASTLTVGDGGTRLPNIPAGVPDHHVEMTCPSECTQHFDHDIKVFGDYFHMHEIGRSGWSWIHREGQEPIPLSRVEYYAFANQHGTPVDVTLKRGDRINTHCVWDSSRRSEPTRISIASTDEMCIEFLTYYPALPNFPLCSYMRTNTLPNTTYCGRTLLDVPNPSIRDPPGGLARLFGTADMSYCESSAATIAASIVVLFSGLLLVV
jgi:hypothetical protein